MVRREVVGAHYGLRDWLAQRITAVVMLVYTLLVLLALVMLPKFDYAHWQALCFMPGSACATSSWITSRMPEYG
jgi:succinate dehydrogenase hydrophobic membrane anchor protein